MKLTELKTPEPRTLIYIRIPGEGMSRFQDHFLVHLKPARMKNDSILSRKAQEPPGKWTGPGEWSWWLQPQPWCSGRSGIIVPIGQGLPRKSGPRWRGLTSPSPTSSVTIAGRGLLLQVQFPPRLPAPFPGEASSRAKAVLDPSSSPPWRLDLTALLQRGGSALPPGGCWHLNNIVF